MGDIWHHDDETTSRCEIKLGAYRYACDPSTRILLKAIACNDEKPVVWDSMDPKGRESKEAIDRLRAAAADRDALLYAHNSGFEVAIGKYRWATDLGVTMPSLDRFRCTMAMCRRAAIPPSLADASAFLRLGEAKDKRGKALIWIFSDQNRLVTLTKGKEKMKVPSPLLVDPVPWDWHVTVAGESITVREAWEMFRSYCGQDTVVEREIHKALAKFELTDAELDGFLFDARMNERGVPVNMDALKHAQTLIERNQTELTEEFVTITGLQPSQTAKVLAWLREHGYPGDNLQASTMEEWTGSSFMSEQGQRALQIRADLSFAAIKKVGTMIATACPDNRMRGLFNWYGAQRTGRWTSTGPQLQNAKKPTIDNHHEAYEDICDQMDFETFRAFYGNPYEAVASCVRNFVQPHEGRMLDADYSNIESRVAALIAGQESMLQAYRDGRDLYKELAAVIFNVPLEQVTKEQRFVAKTASLACVYQTGAKTFHETCAMWGMPIEKKLACHTVRTFRETNAEFPKTWRKFENAAVKAIETPGEWFEVNEFVAFAVSRSKPFRRLLMRLPSGRNLVYPLPKVERAVKRHRDYETGEVREWETNEISFWGARQGFTGWGWISTYAGDLFQSSVQGTARDIMQHGCVNAERKGFDIFSIIHDQALGNEGCPDAFAAALCEHPDWLPKDFPLQASSTICDFYTKD